MLIQMTTGAKSVAPMSCTVFLSHIVVCLEGDIGKEVWFQIKDRGPCRFGRIDYWVNGERQFVEGLCTKDEQPYLPVSIEECDLFILVGQTEQILKYREITRGSRVMNLIITLDEGDDYVHLKETWGSEKTVFTGIQADPQSKEAIDCLSLVLDSLVGLFNYYEYGLVRFSLYDLRHIWSDGSDLGIEYHQLRLSQMAGESKTPQLISHSSSRLTKTEPAQDLDSLLIVVRGPEDLSPELMEVVVHTTRAEREGIEGIHWYAIGCSTKSEWVEGIVFLCHKKG
ncbi:MAG: hypothetical protein ACOX5W_04135 [Bacillota bacterium]|jgi:hypothetical protein